MTTSWRTPNDLILVQLEAEETTHTCGCNETTTFLEEAYTYELREPSSQAVVERFEGSIIRGERYRHNHHTMVTLT